jgi:hypothetical protein
MATHRAGHIEGEGLGQRDLRESMMAATWKTLGRGQAA